MKGKIISLVILWGVSFCASQGWAQTSHQPALTVKVPFEFVVGNQTFPAGNYSFQSLLHSVPGKATIDVLEVRSTEGHRYQAIVADVISSEEPAHPLLVFTRRSGRAFLSEVWETGNKAACRLPNPKVPTETAENENNKLTLIAEGER